MSGQRNLQVILLDNNLLTEIPQYVTRLESLKLIRWGCLCAVEGLYVIPMLSSAAVETFYVVMTSLSTSGGPLSRLSIIRKKTLYKRSSVSSNHSHGNYLKTLIQTTFMSSKILLTFPRKKLRIAQVVHYVKNLWWTKMLSKPSTGDLILKWKIFCLNLGYICLGYVSVGFFLITHW